MVCLMPNLHSNPNINPKILGDNDLVIWREREKLDNGKRERERERERERGDERAKTRVWYCSERERDRGA